MKVILYDNSHRRDYWHGGSAGWLTTWMLIEDDGTQDGGKLLAEFRDRADAVKAAQALDWEVTL